MIDLDEKIFGNITSKEIIGSDPIKNEIERLLDNEYTKLVNDLTRLEKSQLIKLKEKQIQLEKQMNNRPGAMAISQEKIRLFTKFNQNYIKKIEEKLNHL